MRSENVSPDSNFRERLELCLARELNNQSPTVMKLHGSENVCSHRANVSKKFYSSSLFKAFAVNNVVNEEFTSSINVT